MIDQYNTEPLAAGMFLSIEPWLYDPSGLGVFALEEQVYVSPDGPVVISTLERDQLRIVS
jgi:Xaa-Pro aminopeptidase